MSKFTITEAERYDRGQGDFDWFFINKDGGIKHVHFLDTSIDAIDAFSLHRVKFATGKSRWVNCLRQKPDDPVDVCPLCANGNKAGIRLFIQFWDVDTKRIDIWDRGTTIVPALRSLERHLNGNTLDNALVEITRNGARGDTNTTYSFYPLKFEQLQPKPQKFDINQVILFANKESLQTFVDTGDFPGYGSNKEERRDSYEPRPVARQEHQPLPTTPTTPAVAPSVPVAPVESNPIGQTEPVKASVPTGEEEMPNIPFRRHPKNF